MARRGSPSALFSSLVLVAGIAEDVEEVAFLVTITGAPKEEATRSSFKVGGVDKEGEDLLAAVETT